MTPTPTLHFESLQTAHLDELARVMCHPAVYAHIGGEVPSRERFKEGMRRGLAGPPQDRPGERWLNVLIRDAAGAMLGRLEATLHHGFAEVAYLLGPAHWGRGIATAGLRWLHDELAQVHGVQEVWATTAPANHRSQAVLMRCGYQAAALPEAPLYSHGAGDLVFRRTLSPR